MDSGLSRHDCHVGTGLPKDFGRDPSCSRVWCDACGAGISLIAACSLGLCCILRYTLGPSEPEVRFLKPAAPFPHQVLKNSLQLLPCPRQELEPGWASAPHPGKAGSLPMYTAGPGLRAALWSLGRGCNLAGLTPVLLEPSCPLQDRDSKHTNTHTHTAPHLLGPQASQDASTGGSLTWKSPWVPGAQPLRISVGHRGAQLLL